jgi:anti-anti-sigma regulatory factor
VLDELEFAVSSVRVGGTHVVRVFGELDLYTAPELREELDDLPSGVTACRST